VQVRFLLPAPRGKRAFTSFLYNKQSRRGATFGFVF